ncbi:MAG: hypothetical protein E7172_04630 [Firmicutes bacterium]|nr:hypothetical protein [Bacillota bacterium]
MIKKYAFKKIILATLVLIILLLIYFFPNKEIEYQESLTYIEKNDMPIFLLDANNYVSRTTIFKTKENHLDLIPEIIEALTINGPKSSYIPTNFKAIIPQNTKLLNYDLNEGLLKLNFSKEFLNIDQKNEEKLIESLIYSLTEIKEIKKIMIFIEGIQLTKLPNSQKKLPQTLDKNYGINKIYNLDSLKETNKTTIYYLSKYDNFYYYVPVTHVTNAETERVEVIIENLKSTPIYHTNLISYLTASANLLNYELLENSINLSFDNLLIANLKENNILEEVKYSIALSLRDTYGITDIFLNNEQLFII